VLYPWGRVVCGRNVCDAKCYGANFDGQVGRKSDFKTFTVGVEDCSFLKEIIFLLFHKKAKIEKISEGLLLATRLAVFYDSPLIMTEFPVF
jgi:hypothetical protein